MPAPNNNSRQNARLRAKSGCWTCRARRKKCDETRPNCHRCSQSRRLCTWPRHDQMTDRRWLPRSKSSQITDRSFTNIAIDVLQSTDYGILEPILIDHFMDKLLPLLWNPESSSEFHEQVTLEVQQDVLHCEQLRYTVLANAASHLYLIGQSPRMQDLALNYYSKSLREMSREIAKPTCMVDATSGAMLIAIILLYLHGVIGLGTTQDSLVHVDAAAILLQHEYHSPSMVIMCSRIGRMLIESVAFQVFLLTMGQWSKPEQITRQHSPQFWIVCDGLLRRLTNAFGDSVSMQNPVLGMDMGILKLMTTIKQCFSVEITSKERQRLLAEAVEETPLWLAWLELLHGLRTMTGQGLYGNCIASDAARLTILAASIFVEHLSQRPNSYLTLPHPSVSDWQMEQILAILRRRRNDAAWSSSYLGSWPVYTVGIFMCSREHIELVRNDVRERWNALRMSSIKRYWDDLEKIWKNVPLPGISEENHVTYS